MTQSNLTITLFGEFSLTPVGKPAVNFAGDRPISLLAYLLLHRHTAVSRQHLAFTLWPDSADSQARANLRNLYFTLRHILPDADNYLVADSMTLQWRPDMPISFDVAQFEEELAAAKAAVSLTDKTIHLETAINLYKGDLLPGNYDDWIIPLREDFRQTHLDALHQLVLLLEQQQDYRPAARYSQRLLQQDPLDETAYIQLMRLHALSGDRAGVRRVYDACMTTLRRELDVEPGPATQIAYEQLLRLELPVLEIVARPSPPTRLNPLPVPATPFIDRRAELAQIAEMLADPTCRLLTIVGPGGMGKTRLALQTASNHQCVFTDGVAFVPLEDISKAIHALSAIATALNFTFSGQGDPQAQLFNYLHAKNMLLVLDNVDGFLDEIGLLADLLQASTGIVLLVTSRERLNLQGEWLFPLDGLPIPAEEGEAAAGSISENPAVRLFLHSAQRLRPDFVPDGNDYQALRRICDLVSGMPLGLELAATWVRLLSCEEIACELEQGIGFLATTQRDVPLRHRSISAVFDYSWNLLTIAEQQLLARLSVFHGGFTRDAAQKVAGATLPLLAALVDKSFVRPAQSGRYTMHELINQYAAGRLAEQPEGQRVTAVRHGNYFLHLLVEQKAALYSARQKEILSRFTADISNLLRAWEWAAQERDLAQLREASWPLWYFFELRGLFGEGERAFYQAETMLQADLAQRKAPTADLLVVYANLQTHRAYFSFRRGNSTEAQHTLNEVIATLRQYDDEDALGDALLLRGSMLWFGGEYAASAEVTREALDISCRRERPWQIMIHTTTLGVMLHELGDYDQAYRLLVEGLAQARALGDPHAISFATSFLSRTAQVLGHTAETAALLQDGLHQALEMNDRFAMALAWEQLGKMAQAQGEMEEAYSSFNESIALFREMGDDQSLVRMLNQLGDAQAQAGDMASAERHYRDVLATPAAGESWPAALHALCGLGQLFALQGKNTSAWILAAILLQQPISPTLQAQVETMQQAAQPNLTQEQQRAACVWIGERPLAALIDDILQNKLPV